MRKSILVRTGYGAELEREGSVELRDAVAADDLAAAAEGRINIRIETHPLQSGGPAVRHANVETIREAGGKKKIENIHITN